MISFQSKVGIILDAQLALSQPSWNNCSLARYNEILQAYVPFTRDMLGHLPLDRAGDYNTGSKGGTH